MPHWLTRKLVFRFVVGTDHKKALVDWDALREYELEGKEGIGCAIREVRKEREYKELNVHDRYRAYWHRTKTALPEELVRMCDSATIWHSLVGFLAYGCDTLETAGWALEHWTSDGRWMDPMICMIADIADCIKWRADAPLFAKRRQSKRKRSTRLECDAGGEREGQTYKKRKRLVPWEEVNDCDRGPSAVENEGSVQLHFFMDSDLTIKDELGRDHNDEWTELAYIEVAPNNGWFGNLRGKYEMVSRMGLSEWDIRSTQIGWKRRSLTGSFSFDTDDEFDEFDTDEDEDDEGEND